MQRGCCVCSRRCQSERDDIVKRFRYPQPGDSIDCVYGVLQIDPLILPRHVAACCRSASCTTDCVPGVRAAHFFQAQTHNLASSVRIPRLSPAGHSSEIFVKRRCRLGAAERSGGSGGKRHTCNPDPMGGAWVNRATGVSPLAARTPSSHCSCSWSMCTSCALHSTPAVRAPWQVLPPQGSGPFTRHSV